MSATEDLYAKIMKLRAQLKDAEDKYKASVVAASRWRAGDVWEGPGGIRGKVSSVVVEIDHGSQIYTRPRLTIFKKDGTLGTRTKELWSWEAKAWTLIKRGDDDA